MSIPNTYGTAPAFITDEPDWKHPVLVESVFHTTVSKTRSSNEQRGRCRAQAKTNISYTMSGLTPAEHALRRAKQITETGAGVVCPVWLDTYSVTANTISGRMTFSQSIEFSRFKVGGYAYVTQSGKTPTFLRIIALGSNFIDYATTTFAELNTTTYGAAEIHFGQNLAAGPYRVEYVRGYLNDNLSTTGPWRLNLPGAANGFFVRHSGAFGTAPPLRQEQRFPGTESEYVNVSGVEAANAGRFMDFNHTGGAIGIVFKDTDYRRNYTPRPPRFRLRLLNQAGTEFTAGATAHPCVTGMRSDNAFANEHIRHNRTNEVLNVEEL